MTGAIERLSVASDGSQGSFPASPGPQPQAFGLRRFAISLDDRTVAFSSPHGNLVPNDGNGRLADVYVRDLANFSTVLVSTSRQGGSGNAPSRNPALSSDGRFVAFESLASNLVVNDSLGFDDVFLVDRDTDGDGIDDEPGATSLARLSRDASQGGDPDGASHLPSISGDGRFVVFESEATNLASGDANGFADVFLFDRATGYTTRLSAPPAGQPGEANGESRAPAISATDARFVAFESTASNLEFTIDRNPEADILVLDRATGYFDRASVTSAGDQANGECRAPSISPDGRYVAFASRATNLDPSDTNNAWDIFVRDRAAGTTVRVSTDSSGVQGDLSSAAPSLSADGCCVAFESLATNLVASDTNALRDVFVHDLQGVTILSVGPPVGSELGGEIVRVHGWSFTTASDTSIAFGGAAAAVLEVTPVRITVRSPASAPGTGAVDVRVANANGAATLPSSFRYIDPSYAARRGNVNIGASDSPENVLLVNAVSGDELTREVFAPVNTRVDVVMASSPSRAQSSYVVYVWLDAPPLGTAADVPAGLGRMVLPPPMVPAGRPQPVRIFNNIGHRATLGPPTPSCPRRPCPSIPPPAPSFVFRAPNGSPVARTVTLQGVIQDDASQVPQGFSITNAIILRVAP